MPDGKVLETLHAEFSAISAANKAGGKIKEVVVFRINRQGKLTMARPCDHCMKVFRENGVKERIISHTNWQGDLVKYE